MVEAIEDLFVPLLVYNNREEDASLLKMFGEPSWNNPVVRFLDENGKDIISRKDGVWKTGPLAVRMAESLKKAGRPVPGYLRSVIDASADKIRRASFAMA